VREGVDNAMGLRASITGIPPEFAAVLTQMVNEPEMAAELVLSMTDEIGDTNQMRAEETANLALQEDVRRRAAAEITLEQRFVAELREHVLRGNVGTALRDALQELDLSMSDFYQRCFTTSDFLSFFAGVASLDVTITLTVARDQDLLRPIESNDARDLIGLSVAVPYGNIVVAEKYWGNMVRSRGLAAKYNTTVLTDARELPRRLAESRCL
jgi:hypothetical protein